MNIEELTIKQAREIAGLFSGDTNQTTEGGCPWEVGKPYFIQTVTHYYTGRLIGKTATELVLEDAAWIADTGRFTQAMESPDNFSEVEVYPDGRQVIIGRGSIISAVQQDSLRREQK